MITKRNTVIPIFDIYLTIIIFDNNEDIISIPDFTNQGKFRGITMFNSDKWSIKVAIDSNFPSTIVHESEHVKNIIWNFIGYKPDPNNDEIDAYVIKYIYNKIVSVYYKHVGENYPIR